MSILVGPETKLVVTGLTGREGSFHAANNPQIHPAKTMLEAADMVVALAKDGS